MLEQTVLTEIPVGFKGLPGTVVITDFAFVSDENRSILVLCANSDNDIVLVDMNDPNYRMTKLALTDAAESTGGRERFLEWAVGTNYIWVTGGEVSELYVVALPSGNIEDAKVAQTIGGVLSGEFIFVDNYERKAAAQTMQAMLVGEQGAIATTDSASSKGDHQHSSFGEEFLGNEDESSDDVFPIALGALIVGLMSLLMSTFLLIKVVLLPAGQTGPGNEPKQESAPADDAESHMATKTLGSKMVA